MNNPRIYDSRPSRDAMLARCKRDRIDPACLHELTIKQRHYALVVYGYRTTAPAYAQDIATGEWRQLTVPAWRVYSMRRDGRISNHWSIPVKDQDVLSNNGPAGL